MPVTMPCLEVEVTLTDFDLAKRRAGRRRSIRRTSLTKVELGLLQSIGKTKQAATNADDSSTKKNEENEVVEEGSNGDLPTTRRPARRRESAVRLELRRSMCRHRGSMTVVESEFLEELLESDVVRDEYIANAGAVLETDVAYKRCLSPEVRHRDSVQGRRRRSSVLAYESNSRRSSFRLSNAFDNSNSSDFSAAAAAVVAAISEMDMEGELSEAEDEKVKNSALEESPMRDAAYRRELWRTRQCSTIKDDFDAENDSQGEVKDEDAVRSPTAGSAFSESTIMSFFNNFVDVECSPDVVEASSSSDDEEDGDARYGSSSKLPKKASEKSPVSFLLMGVSPTDENATGLNVLTPPLMDTLRRHVPYALRDDNFWLKYSLARDGASIESLLAKARSSTNTILAIETMEGEVFGSFTSSAWRHKGQSYYGSCEAFLWCMKRDRRTPCSSILERAELESDVEVFKWSGQNRNVQMCSSSKMLAVGGGEADRVIEKRLPYSYGAETKKPHSDNDESQASDFGLALNFDLSCGTSGPCVTFGTDSSLSSKGSTFEVSNVEVWTFTPMCDVEHAEKLELSRQFVFNSVTSPTSGSIQTRRASKMARAA